MLPLKDEYKEIFGRNFFDISFDNIAHFYNSYCLKSLVKFLFRPALADAENSQG